MQKGIILTHRFQSKILKTNPLGDPFERDIIVYLPPGYERSNSKGYVTAFGLAGFGGQGRTFLNIDPLGENLEDKMNRLITSKMCGPLLLVLVDCYTKFGGSQYINSNATGNYEDYIISEIIPFIDNEYNVSSRAVWGKSSGGYGSFVLATRNPTIFAGFADHSGDAAFEYCYLPDFPKALDSFRKNGGPKNWLKRFSKKLNKHQKDDASALNILAMAAHYSPNPEEKELGIDLPFDYRTGEISETVWNRWLGWDPIRLVHKYQTNLRKLKFIYIDCGSRDEYNLIWGARILHSKLERLKIGHVYEEFDDGHMNINYRYDVSLPKIYNALSN
jgi:S-formylglutathione hydrolase FrmB